MERRIILVGNAGCGKSSTGNSLLSGQTFQTGCGPTAVTQKCQAGYFHNAKNNIQYTIVDTPGFTHTDVPISKRLLEIQRSVEICPDPHAFLLVFSSVTRMTKDDVYTIDLLPTVFGEKVFDHCIVVFTHGNRFSSDQEFEKFWKQSSVIVELVERCGGRIKRIENGSLVNHGNAIINLIENMSDGGNKIYHDYSWTEQHVKVLQEDMQRHDDTRDFSELAHALREALFPNVWTFLTIVLDIAAAVWSFASRVGFWLW